jgi:hypothetical protein
LIGARRRGAVLGVLAAVAIGGGSRLCPVGLHLWDKSVGDVAFALMVGFVVRLVWPRASASAVAGTATALCFALEVFQLTGLPARAPRLLRVVLGTTFSWHDLACYAVGGALLAVYLRITSSRAARSASPSS